MRIAIISHQIDTFENSGYLLNRLIAEWKRNGVEIVVIRGARDPLPGADLAILHTDITAVGDDYARVIDHYPKVINGRVKDTSKTSFSSLLVKQGDRYGGPVIVKTNANYGGMRERLEKAEAGDTTVAIEAQRPWRRVEWLDTYPVFPSAAEVPLGVWRNPRLVAEKFLPERNEAGEYLLRIWVFFGDRDIYYQCVSSEPVIKSDNTLRREPLEPADLPTDLRETRARLGFDFGKFDFGVHGGEVVLYDVNRTPGFPRGETEPETVRRNMEWLSGGLEYFTGRRDS